MRALLSVANRDGIVSLARELLALDVEVYATDGTRDHLAADGVEVRPVSELTGLPSLLGGQVKTFHPAIYAGILAAWFGAGKRIGRMKAVPKYFGILAVE